MSRIPQYGTALGRLDRKARIAARQARARQERKRAAAGGESAPAPDDDDPAPDDAPTPEAVLQAVRQAPTLVRPEPHEPHRVDLHVGNRVRLRRRIMGISQQELAASLGLTFQQVQKYERGANRISASKLFDAARTLKAPITYFFEGLTQDAKAPLTGEAEVLEFMGTPAGLELAIYFPRLSLALQRRVRDLVRTMADAADPTLLDLQEGDDAGA